MDFITIPTNPNSQNNIVCTTMTNNSSTISSPLSSVPSSSSRYESQKRRDWNTFCQHLTNHKPPLSLSSCGAGHVLQFLRYLDRFGKTKVHLPSCPFFGDPNPPFPCPCPLRQAWGSLDSLVGRLRAAYEEHGGRPETNPFGVRAVRVFLREVRDFQSKSRGVSYHKNRKKKKNNNHNHNHNHMVAMQPCGGSQV